MNKQKFGNWCESTQGTNVEGIGMTEHCHLDDKIVTYSGNSMSVNFKGERDLRIKGPSHKFFVMEDSELATTIEDHQFIF